MPFGGKGVKWVGSVGILELVVVVGLKPVDRLMLRVTGRKRPVAGSLAPPRHVPFKGHLSGLPRY